MTEKGRKFTLELRKKAALDSKRKFEHEVCLFERLIAESKSHEVIKKRLQALKVFSENTLQEFVNCLNLTTDPGEISEITSKQQEVQVSWEKIRAGALRRLDYLDWRDETKSHSSRGSRRSKLSQTSARSHSSRKDALLGAAAKRAVLEQRLRFSDSVKDQEKALAKLRIQQELCETVAEEAVYREAFDEENQHSGGESDSELPTAFGNIIDTYLHDQDSCLPTQPPVTQPLNDTLSSVPVPQPLVSTVTESSVPVTQSSVNTVPQPSVSTIPQPLVPVTEPSVPVPHPSVTTVTES